MITLIIPEWMTWLLAGLAILALIGQLLGLYLYWLKVQYIKEFGEEWKP